MNVKYEQNILNCSVKYCGVYSMCHSKQWDSHLPAPCKTDNVLSFLQQYQLENAEQDTEAKMKTGKDHAEEKPSSETLKPKLRQKML